MRRPASGAGSGQILRAEPHTVVRSEQGKDRLWLLDVSQLIASETDQRPICLPRQRGETSTFRSPGPWPDPGARWPVCGWTITVKPSLGKAPTLP